MLLPLLAPLLSAHMLLVMAPLRIASQKGLASAREQLQGAADSAPRSPTANAEECDSPTATSSSSSETVFALDEIPDAIRKNLRSLPITRVS